MSKTRGAKVVLVSLLTSITLLVTGCQIASPETSVETSAAVDLPPLDSLVPVDDPSSVTGPVTAPIGGPSIEPIADHPTQQLPAETVSRDRGGDRPVTVEDASRVLALSITGTLADFVHAYGLTDLLVGRDVSTSIPGVEDLPIVTRSGHSIDAEGVLGLSPTLILTDGSIGPVDVVMQLQDAGITVVNVNRITDFDSTFESARDVARALGVPELGDELVEVLQQAIADKRAEIERLMPDDPARLPRVVFLYLRGTAGIYYLFGEGSGADSLIEAVGAVDVAQEVGWVGERPMTDEALVAINPDVIIVMSKGLESVGGVDGMLAELPSVALTNAGMNSRIIDVDDQLLFAGGTRIPDVLDGLARALYAPDSLSSNPVH